MQQKNIHNKPKSMHILLAAPCRRYATDDGTNGGFFRFVADRPGDLTSGARPLRRPDYHCCECRLDGRSPLAVVTPDPVGRDAAAGCAQPTLHPSATHTGPLYAARFKQNSALNGGAFSLSWIYLGKGGCCVGLPNEAAKQRLPALRAAPAGVP